MSKQVEKNISFISLLARSEDGQKIALLKSMTIEQMKVIIECVYNVLYGVVPMNTKTKNNLSRYKNVIRELTDKETTRVRRKKLLLKYRFVLPPIIKLVLDHINHINQNDEGNDSDSEAEV